MAGINHPDHTAPEFEIKDSGTREQYSGGMVRDTADRGIAWSNIHYGPMLFRWATHCTKGREKYEDPEPGIPNWTLGKADAMAIWLRAQESFERHAAAWLGGWYDEDHAAAIFFNVNLKEFVEAYLTSEERAHCRRIQALRAHEPSPRVMPEPVPNFQVPAELTIRCATPEEVRELLDPAPATLEECRAQCSGFSQCWDLGCERFERCSP